jgi:predicted alpha/beta-hydrolase family hydrolase
VAMIHDATSSAPSTSIGLLRKLRAGAGWAEASAWSLYKTTKRTLLTRRPRPVMSEALELYAKGAAILEQGLDEGWEEERRSGGASLARKVVLHPSLRAENFCIRCVTYRRRISLHYDYKPPA